MMKRIIAALVSAILISAPTASTAARPTVKPIEKRWVWYNVPWPEIQVGETIFYCDGTQSGSGFVTGDYYEEYYGCP
jgi:hypothetical protein